MHLLLDYRLAWDLLTIGKIQNHKTYSLTFALIFFFHINLVKLDSRLIVWTKGQGKRN